MSASPKRRAGVPSSPSEAVTKKRRSEVHPIAEHGAPPADPKAKGAVTKGGTSAPPPSAASFQKTASDAGFKTVSDVRSTTAKSDLGKKASDAKSAIAVKADRAKSDLGKKASDMKSTLASAADRTKSDLGDKASDAKTKMASAADRAKSDLGKKASDAKSKLSEKAHSMAKEKSDAAKTATTVSALSEEPSVTKGKSVLPKTATTPSATHAGTDATKPFPAFPETDGRTARRIFIAYAAFVGSLALVHLLRFVAILADDFPGWSAFYGYTEDQREDVLPWVGSPDNMPVSWGFPGAHGADAAFELFVFLALGAILVGLYIKKGRVIANGMLLSVVLMFAVFIIHCCKASMFTAYQTWEALEKDLGLLEEERGLTTGMETRYAFLIIWMVLDLVTGATLVLLTFYYLETNKVEYPSVFARVGRSVNKILSRPPALPTTSTSTVPPPKSVAPPAPSAVSATKK